MKLGFCSISALDRPLADVAHLAATLGLDGIEVTQRAPHLTEESPAYPVALAVVMLALPLSLIGVMLRSLRASRWWWSATWARSPTRRSASNGSSTRWIAATWR